MSTTTDPQELANVAHIWTTPEHEYIFTPISKDTIRVQSDCRESIEAFLSTVELSGPEEGTEIPDSIEQENIYTWGNELVYFIEVSRATVSLFFDFEVRYYMGVPVA